MDLVQEYLKLGLRFDRVVEGYVDAYTRSRASCKAEVAAEPPPDPADLGRQAAALSAAGRRPGFDAARAGFLPAHLDALAVGGRRLAGERCRFVDEVHSYFQVASPRSRPRSSRQRTTRSPSCSAGADP